jgi:hypothetical protein
MKFINIFYVHNIYFDIRHFTQPKTDKVANLLPSQFRKGSEPNGGRRNLSLGPARGAAVFALRSPAKCSLRQLTSDCSAIRRALAGCTRRPARRPSSIHTPGGPPRNDVCMGSTFGLQYSYVSSFVLTSLAMLSASAVS